MFKIGDRVKVVANPSNSGTVEDHMGKEGTIISFLTIDFDYVVEFNPMIKGYGTETPFNSNELELINPQLTFIFSGEL